MNRSQSVAKNSAIKLKWLWSLPGQLEGITAWNRMNEKRVCVIVNEKKITFFYDYRFDKLKINWAEVSVPLFEYNYIEIHYGLMPV